MSSDCALLRLSLAREALLLSHGVNRFDADLSEFHELQQRLFPISQQIFCFSGKNTHHTTNGS